MDQSQQSGAAGPTSSSQQGAQSSSSTSSTQQEQFSAAAGQQGGASGGSAAGNGGAGSQQGAASGSDDTSRRSGNPYTDFFSRRGTSPMDLLKRLDEDVDRLFHEFVGGGREKLRSRLRGWSGGGQAVDAPAAAGSSGGTDESYTEAPGTAGGSGVAMAPGGGWLPEVEVSERNGKLVVHADLPGLSREQVQIGFEDGQLVLAGERRSTQTSVQPGGYYRTERTYGHFKRVIPLPEGVNPDTAQAGFHNGVLEVCFDMPPRHTRTRQIPINDGHPSAAPAGGTGMAGGAGAAGSEVGS
ncbi:Hsp20/alpha crystallin family protein [Azohydromonas aeria]|uniref:Hsp20/alpha crystallin family protein n=1 Tax=Azohydromonas aeria TaxID=2590212 RepID=UPI0012FCC9F6|nr:Hsp20/alpha crystallin family protein [Azohydromonas aeria]